MKSYSAAAQTRRKPEYNKSSQFSGSNRMERQRFTDNRPKKQKTIRPTFSVNVADDPHGFIHPADNYTVRDLQSIFRDYADTYGELDTNMETVDDRLNNLEERYNELQQQLNVIKSTLKKDIYNKEKLTEYVTRYNSDARIFVKVIQKIHERIKRSQLITRFMKPPTLFSLEFLVPIACEQSQKPIVLPLEIRFRNNSVILPSDNDLTLAKVRVIEQEKRLKLTNLPKVSHITEVELYAESNLQHVE